jgi:DNA-binding winged helix-turn-helix (wHTH) protein
MVRFGTFELDVRAGELRKDGVKIRLQEQPFRILAMLLEHPGEVVMREDIRRRLWPNDTVVEVSHGINAAVLRLREALGDSAENPRYVETLARRGYRFIGQAEVEGGPVARGSATAASAIAVSVPAAPFPEAPEPAGFTGQTVCHYRVLEKLGSGGMGVVYRAEDLKLGRQVALKFLPRELTADPLALGRFQREARAASSLNHPNICTIYSVEDFSGQPVIAMELLEGQTLEAVLAKGSLPVGRALRLAVRIAEALDAAHRKGIVHRDLKPGNVLVTKAGLKVLDFGLAKMDRALFGNRQSEAAPVTQEGAILGTLHYMSPEQIQGREAGACSDIFSFGLVLHEMLTGQHAFDGPNQASVMAAILTAEPAPLPEATCPPVLRGILQRCLAKDPEDRWQTACDLKAALEFVGEFGHGGMAAIKAGEAGEPPVRPAAAPVALAIEPATELAASRPARRFVAKLPHFAGRTGIRIMGSLFVAALLLVAATRLIPFSNEPSRLMIPGPGNLPVTRLALAPDGRRVAFMAGGRLYLRAFDSNASLGMGSPGMATPFWSPDGRRIAYADGSKLKTVEALSGLPVTLCDVHTNTAGAWGPDGTILIGQVGSGIFRVSANGGALTAVTQVDPAQGETRHLLPQFLPDGRRFLFIAASNRAGASMLYAGSLDSAERRRIMPMESSVAFVAAHGSSEQGYLIFRT